MASPVTFDGWMILLEWFREYRHRTVLASLIERTKDGGWVVGRAH